MSWLFDRLRQMAEAPTLAVVVITDPSTLSASERAQLADLSSQTARARGVTLSLLSEPPSPSEACQRVFTPDGGDAEAVIQEWMEGRCVQLQVDDCRLGTKVQLPVGHMEDVKPCLFLTDQAGCGVCFEGSRRAGVGVSVGAQQPSATIVVKDMAGGLAIWDALLAVRAELSQRIEVGGR